MRVGVFRQNVPHLSNLPFEILRRRVEGLETGTVHEGFGQDPMRPRRSLAASANQDIARIEGDLEIGPLPVREAIGYEAPNRFATELLQDLRGPGEPPGWLRAGSVELVRID